MTVFTRPRPAAKHALAGGRDREREDAIDARRVPR
jgi:hypothetical protein